VAATRLGTPTAVHESNAVPGLAVRKLVPYVDRIFVNFRVTEEALRGAGPEKIRHVGCPVSDGVGTISREQARAELGIPDSVRHCVLSFGGSLGARTLNETALELMSDYMSVHPEVRFVHACGADGYDSVYERFVSLGLDRYPNIELLRYIYDMPLQLAAADLVICRSGAITCSELSRAKRASILIPSPNVTDDQQVKNAMVLEDCGGALMIEEGDLEPGRVRAAVEKLLSVPGMTDEMGRRAASASPADANDRIFGEILELVSGGRSGK
jgi:UDP-N-acetylglucosamine--N-acetylmuramyl-(pentapeptide) pyrophosphoryl-undecaprenol N-acetylglucosamine transferase